MNGLSSVAGLQYSAGRDPRNKSWCGPTAIASITGMDYLQACAAISMVRGEPFRRESTLHELKVVLEKRGYWVEGMGTPNKPTLAEFMNKRLPSHRMFPLVVRVTNHFVAVHGDTICDTRTGGQAVPFAEFKRKHAIVTDILVVRPTPTFAA